MFCAGGYHCVEDSRGAHCDPEAFPKRTCEGLKCEAGYVCSYGSVGPYCALSTKSGCELINCQTGFVCKEKPEGGGQCVPLRGDRGCDMFNCPQDLRCVDMPEGPQCIRTFLQLLLFNQSFSFNYGIAALSKNHTCLRSGSVGGPVLAYAGEVA